MRDRLITKIIVFLGVLLLTTTTVSAEEPHRIDGTWERQRIREASLAVPFAIPPSRLLSARQFNTVGLTDHGPLRIGEQATYTEHFRIIWGEDHPSNDLWADQDANQLPDYIDLIAATAEEVWEQLISSHEFQAPINSDIHYIDIYLGNTGLLDPVLVGVNLTMSDSFFGWADDYSVGSIVDPTPMLALNASLNENALKVTLAHEFFHTVQAAYKPAQAPFIDGMTELWWYEASAVWIESLVYPEIDDYTHFIKHGFMNSPSLSLFHFNARHEYGSAIWAKYLSEFFHDETDPQGALVIRKIWEYFQQNSLITSFSRFLNQQDVQPEINNFSEGFAQFATTLLQPELHYHNGAAYGELAPHRNIESTSLRIDGFDFFEVAPEPLGFQVQQIQNDPEQPARILHFDGLDEIEGLPIDWLLSLSIEYVDGSVSAAQQFAPKGYHDQILLLPEHEHWTQATLLLTPLPTNLKDISLFGALIVQSTHTSVDYYNAPFALSLSPKSSPSFLEVGWQRLNAQHAPPIDQQSVRDHGGLHYDLKQGWNLIGDSLLISFLDIETRFASITPYIESAWSWQEDHWEAFSSDFSRLQAEIGPELEPLTHLRGGNGLWLNMTTDLPLYLPPQTPGSQSEYRSSNETWRLMVANNTPLSRESLFLTTTTYAQIWWQDDSEWQTLILDDDTTQTLPAGTGFWLYQK